LSHKPKLGDVIKYVGPIPGPRTSQLQEDYVMKYVLLIYQAKDYDPKALSPDEHKSVALRYHAVTSTPNVRPGLPLGFSADAITVRARNGETVTTPGPYVEQAGGAVGGYLEFEAETDEEAIQLAAKIPAVSQGGAVEIRPSRIYW
jgi:hypothetical protein